MFNHNGSEKRTIRMAGEKKETHYKINNIIDWRDKEKLCVKNQLMGHIEENLLYI